MKQQKTLLRSKSPVVLRGALRVIPSCKVYTPPLLARSMIASIKEHEAQDWLEPCVGKGALIEALSEYSVPSERVTGTDLDPNPQPSDRFARVARGVEFLQWAKQTDKRFDCIVANPPYIAIERIQKRMRDAACSISTIGGVGVTRGGNIWYAFLCASINLLRPGGNLCFLLPAAWDYSNYSDRLRSAVVKHFGRLEVYRSATPLFHAEGIQEGAVVLVARNFSSMPMHNATGIVRREFASGDDLISALRDSGSTNFDCRVQPLQRAPVMVRKQTTVPLRDLVSIHIGGVTGDSEYFLLSESQRLERELPTRSLRPVLSRASHLSGPEATAQIWRRLRDKGERVWLFDPTPGIESHPAVKRYIRRGKHGLCNLDSTKVSSRTPWFRTPLCSNIDGFLSGMSKFGPWICFKEMPRLNATNTLYVVRFKTGASETKKVAVALAMLSSWAADEFERIGRRYADGLVKFEPGDLGKAMIPEPSVIKSSIRQYRRVLTTLLSGDTQSARSIADMSF